MRTSEKNLPHSPPAGSAGTGAIGSFSPSELPPAGEGLDLGGTARQYVVETREGLRAWHDAGGSGLAVAGALSAAMDRLILWLFSSASEDYRKRYVQLDQSCAVLAQGGYGRGELNPCSDIDLLFLYERKLTPYVEMVAESILYALWDTRLSVGHAVRTIDDCAQIANNDLTVKTALIDGRFLCGDASLAADFSVALRGEILPRSMNRFFRDRLRASEARQHEYGDSVYLLEPQIKEGQGGLRDLHTALWIAKVRFNAESLQELVDKGVLKEEEFEEISAAADFLFRVRNAIHFLTGTQQDQLTFELQEPIAENLGYTQVESSALRPVEHFLRDYYLKASEVTRLATALIDRSVNPPSPYRLIGRMMARTIRDGVRIVGAELEVFDDDLFSRDPIELLRVLADAQRHGVQLSQGLAERMRREAERIGNAEREAPELTRVFLEILGGRYRVYETLREMHKLGILGRVMPEWEHLRCLVLHDFYHIYTVDEHSLMGVRELERLRAGERSEILPLLTEVMREVDKVELLFLAVLLHDVGKGLGGGHSEKGAELAAAIAARFRLNEDDRQELDFLVRNHLVLSHLAQRRDVQDDKLAIGMARSVGTAESLRRLYLMTYADMRATGPKVWNNWKDMLLGETYLRVREVFARGFEPEDQRERVARVQARIREETMAREGEEAAGRFDEFCLAMPDTYFLRTPEHLIAKDADLVANARDGGGLEVRVTHYEELEYTGVTVATADRPGLFSVLTGVLAAAGMNIIGARVSTSTDGIVVDSFRISHIDRREIVVDDERWERIRTTLTDVLEGRQSLEDLLARATRPGILVKHKTRPTPYGVGVDSVTSDQFTIIDVYGSDRTGFLHEVAKALHGLGLQIHLAKISTAVDQVLDVFYVTEKDGAKCDRDEEIRRALEPLVVPVEAGGGTVENGAASAPL